MSRVQPVPIVILAGSDPEPARLPQSGAGKHPLRGPKGLQIVLGGQPLIDRLTDVLRGLGSFAPIFVAGPQSSYGASRGDVEVIDTDGSFGENIRAAVEVIAQRCPGRPLAVTVCDILPDASEMRRLMVDYNAHESLDFWFPMIVAPEDTERLGASAWKPRYRIASVEGEAARTILPGHLLVVDPQAARLGFIYRSFDLAYRSRNRPLVHRLFFIVGHLLWYLFKKDVRQLLHLRPPVITLTVIYQAVIIVSKLRRGTMNSEELARRFRWIFVRTAHRRQYPERKGRLPLMSALTLAKDMDTQEEADELAREFASSDFEEAP